jgi:hypothetical protein
LKYFQEQEGQFREDLNTSKQVKARAENKTRVRKAQQNAMIGVVAGIAGGVLISKTADWYKGTDFAKKRADKRAAKQFNKQFNKTGGSYTNRSGRTGYEITGKERRLLRQDVDNFKGQGATASQMRDFLSSQDVQFKMNRMGGGSDYDVTLNRGGRVPAMVTGGEYIMNPKAVKQHGSAMMSSINSGTYSGGGSGSGSNISHGDVNISINVDNNSTSQGGENQLNTKEFSSKVKAAVIQVINQEKRVGGSLR